MIDKTNFFNQPNLLFKRINKKNLFNKETTSTFCISSVLFPKKNSRQIKTNQENQIDKEERTFGKDFIII